MQRMGVGWPLALVSLGFAAFLLRGSAPGESSEAVAIGGALAGLGFSAILLWIAWSAGEWGPVLLALGCISMAAAGLAHMGTSSTFAFLSVGGAADQVPAIGMIAGGVWFGLGAVPRRPVPTAERSGPRLTLLIVVPATMLAAALAASRAEELPAVWIRGLATIGSLGYLYACVQMLQAWRLLRVPSQLVMSLGSLLFIPITLAAASGGLPILPQWSQQALSLSVASLPAAGFIIEQRQRPGLRTMVLALSVPGAVQAMRRGYPTELTNLLTKVDDHDPALSGHIDRVADLAVQTAHAMAFDAGVLREVMLAGQLHDIGKLFISREILDKPGRLDEAEMELIREHSALGAALVRRIPELASAALAVRQHHEKWDGSGYPDGLRGEGIRASARIIAAADVFDALVTERPYKKAWSDAEALAELRRGAGTHFDPRVVDAVELALGMRMTADDQIPMARAA